MVWAYKRDLSLSSMPPSMEFQCALSFASMEEVVSWADSLGPASLSNIGSRNTEIVMKWTAMLVYGLIICMAKSVYP